MINCCIANQLPKKNSKNHKKSLSHKFVVLSFVPNLERVKSLHNHMWYTKKYTFTLLCHSD